MSDHQHSSVERHCDVAIVGATAAGLEAALELAKRGWSVIVVDSAESSDGAAEALPRDRGSQAASSAARATIRPDDVRGYGVEVLAGRATAATRVDSRRVRVDLVGDVSLVARRALAAVGRSELVDDGCVGATDGVDGSRLAEDLGADLAREDEDEGVRGSANELDWDARYGDSQFWSGNPNGTLVAEVGDLKPGRALDVGAGEGADAIWLAEQGWHVVASDISQSGLDRLAIEADRRGLDVTTLRVDANSPGAFGTHAYDLVSAFYAAVPRTVDGRGIANLMDAVAPGGLLLVVGHDLEPMRAPIDTTTHSRAFDPDAFVRVDDIASTLAETADWNVDVHEKRSRPAGSATDAHHSHDVVLRARRLDS